MRRVHLILLILVGFRIVGFYYWKVVVKIHVKSAEDTADFGGFRNIRVHRHAVHKHV